MQSRKLAWIASVADMFLSMMNSERELGEVPDQQGREVAEERADQGERSR